MTKREAREEIRKLILTEFAAIIAAEIPDYADQHPEPLVSELFIEEATRMGRRLAKLYGLDYPERAND